MARSDKKPRRKQEPVGAPSEAVVLAGLERRQTLAEAVKLFTVLAGVGLICLCLIPVAYILRGQETVVNVNIALTLSVAVSVAASGTYLWGREQKKRADRLDSRNKALVGQLGDFKRDVKELQTRLRENDLPTGTSG